MSISKWAYVAEKCDGDFCCGDCDSCPKADENMPVLDHERHCNQCEHYVEHESGKYFACELWECNYEEVEP